ALTIGDRHTFLDTHRSLRVYYASTPGTRHPEMEGSCFTTREARQQDTIGGHAMTPKSDCDSRWMCVAYDCGTSTTTMPSSKVNEHGVICAVRDHVEPVAELLRVVWAHFLSR